MAIANATAIKLLAQQYLRDDFKYSKVLPSNKIPIMNYTYTDYKQWLRDNKITIKPPDNNQIDR